MRVHIILFQPKIIRMIIRALLENLLLLICRKMVWFAVWCQVYELCKYIFWWCFPDLWSCVLCTRTPMDVTRSRRKRGPSLIPVTSGFALLPLALPYTFPFFKHLALWWFFVLLLKMLVAIRDNVHWQQWSSNVEVNCCACVETSSSMTASDVFLLPFELLNYSPIAPLMLFQIAVHYVNFWR